MRRIQDLSKKALYWALVISLILLISCEKPEPEPIEFSGFALGTTYSIKIAQPFPGIDRDNLLSGIVSLLTDVENSMSVFHPESEITRFNQSESTKPQAISPELFEVLSEAMEISESSSGAFDITLGGLIELWGFGKKERPTEVPSENDIQQALADTGFTNLQLDAKSRSLRKALPSLKLNLSAIAKGFAVDRVAQFLEEYEVANYLVEIGGEIRTRGVKKKQMPWRVAIEKPEISKRSLFKILEFENASMATSGDYRNFYEINGVRYSHTINPFDGRPSSNNIASVSVVHRACMTADALATALVVMGYEKGYRFAMNQRIAVLWILRTEDGLVEKSTPDFKSNFNF